MGLQQHFEMANEHEDKSFAHRGPVARSFSGRGWLAGRTGKGSARGKELAGNHSSGRGWLAGRPGKGGGRGASEAAADEEEPQHYFATPNEGEDQTLAQRGPLSDEHRKELEVLLELRSCVKLGVQGPRGGGRGKAWGGKKTMSGITSTMGWTNFPSHQDPCQLEGVTVDSEGYVVGIHIAGGVLSGNLPSNFGVFARLVTLDLSLNSKLTGSIPDLSGCSRLSEVNLHHCNFDAMPKLWPASLQELRVHKNPNLHGEVTAQLILQVRGVQYYGCKRASKEDRSCMLGPFFVGASMASENIRSLLWNRATLGIHGDMLQDPPVKGDPQYTMFRTHGEKWCSWQEVWLNGLLNLHDQPLYVMCGFETFLDKFKTDAVLDENGRDEKICFDATWRLPAGTTARNILDWERRQLVLASNSGNNLNIKYMAELGKELQKPEWYCDEPDALYSKPVFSVDGHAVKLFQYKS